MAIALDLEGTLAARKYAEDADRYSLTGPGFDSFNVASIAPAEERISDGLGHWWDSATQQWMNDSGGAYNAQQSYAQPQDDYFGNFDQYAPENMGTQAYAPPTDRASFIDYAGQGQAPSFNAPGFESPWNPNYQEPMQWGNIPAQTGYSPLNPNPNDQGSGFWGGIGDAASDVWNSDAIQQNPLLGRDVTSLPRTDTGVGYSLQDRSQAVTENALSGEKFQETLGIDTSYMDWLREQGPLGLAASYGVDMVTAPATWITAGLGPSVPIVGSAFGGSFAGRLGGEIALGTTGMLGSAAATSDTAENIPLFGDQPEWLRSLEGGLAAGAGTYGLMKGLPNASGLNTALSKVASEEGSASVAGVAKVAPGPLSIKAGAPEAGIRPGSLLSPRGIEQLGDYNVDDALKVARDLDRQKGSVTNVLMSESEPAWRALGSTFKDADGNVFFKNIPASQAEIDAALPGALATRVLERPGEYALTPLQAKAVAKIGEIEARVANERDLFGVPINRLTMEEGEQYMHRLAVKPSTATQVNALIDEGADTVSLAGGGAGRRLGGGRDKSRIYDDVIDAVRDGVVYAPPKEALRESIETNLKKAADAHVKGLLAPFAQTASDRIPEALRREVEQSKNVVKRLEGRLLTAEKRAGIRSGEGDSLAKMFEAQATGAKLAADAPTADIQTVNRFIQRAQRRITAVRQRGGQFEAEARALSDMLDDARLRVADVMPAWEQAKELARNVPVGRASVPQELAPALIGSDFTKRDAARIRAQLSGGVRVGDKVMNTNIPGVKVLNSVLVPINAIGDASATLNQLAMAGATHRREFVTNFVKVTRDMFDDANYAKWESSPEVRDAAKWVTIMGDSGTRQDFQMGTFVSKIPVLKQTQKHFTRFGNRMRVDAFNSVVDTARRTGAEPDDLFKEQAGRAVNRLTGISASRATDAETLAEFAPNWLRSNIENVAKAVADGSIEGQLARQYWKNYITLGAALVTGVALQQDRDLREVLTPLDMKALDRGEIRLNPNFMTMRVGGQDISAFGTYDSLARLVTLGADSTYRSLRDQDAMQLFDFIGYAAQTKGSPLVKLTTDVIKGETFGGEDPLSTSPMAKRVLPFTASNVVEGIQQGRPTKDIIVDASLGFFGAKSNPMSLTEKLNEAANGDFYSLTPQQRDAILAANPDLKAQVDRSEGDRLSRAIRDRDLNAEKPIGFANLDQINAERLANEKSAADEFKQSKDAKAFRETLDAIQQDAASRRSQVDKDFQLFKDSGELPADPNKRALVEYYNAFDKARQHGVDLDHDALEAEMSRLEKSWSQAQKDYVASKIGKTEHDPDAQKIYDAKATIREAGYWDASDIVFSAWAQKAGLDVGEQSPNQFFSDLRVQMFDYFKQQGADDFQAQLLTTQTVNKIRSPYDEAVGKVRKAMREADPTLMRALVEAGYYQPGKEATAKILAGVE